MELPLEIPPNRRSLVSMHFCKGLHGRAARKTRYHLGTGPHSVADGSYSQYIDIFVHVYVALSMTR